MKTIVFHQLSYTEVGQPRSTNIDDEKTENDAHDHDYKHHLANNGIIVIIIIITIFIT